MPRSQGAKANDIDSVKQISRWAYTLIFVMASGSIAINREAFQKMWKIPTSLDTLPAFIARAGLFFAVLSLIAVWIAATTHELGLWIEWIDVPFVPSQGYLAMLGLAVGLGLMFIFAQDILLFTAYYAGFLAFNLWTQKISNDHFRRSLAMPPLTEFNAPVLKAMEFYWLKRFQLGRIALLYLFAFCAFLLALWTRQRPDRQTYSIAAHFIVIATIFLGEATMIRWRRARDSAIRVHVENHP